MFVLWNVLRWCFQSQIAERAPWPLQLHWDTLRFARNYYFQCYYCYYTTEGCKYPHILVLIYPQICVMWLLACGAIRKPAIISCRFVCKGYMECTESGLPRDVSRSMCTACIFQHVTVGKSQPQISQRSFNVSFYEQRQFPFPNPDPARLELAVHTDNTYTSCINKLCRSVGQSCPTNVGRSAYNNE